MVAGGGVALGVGEFDASGGCGVDGPSAFVDDAVVVVADEHEVVEIGGAAISPPHNVVGVEASGGVAAGELAAVGVALFEGAS